MRARQALFLTPLALLLAGCAPALERNAAEARVYRLGAPTLEAGAPLPVDLLVLRTVVPPGLRTDRIASLWPGNRLDYFAGARWSGDLGAVVQGATVEALSAGGRLRTVEAEPARFGATHVLGLELRRFEADYVAGTPPLARVTLVATVARQSDRRPLGTWTASTEVPTRDNRLGDVTAALDQAFGRALADLLQRTHQALAADVSQPPAPAAR